MALIVGLDRDIGCSSKLGGRHHDDSGTVRVISGFMNGR
jgi:hypothetical protein